MSARLEQARQSALICGNSSIEGHILLIIWRIFLRFLVKEVFCTPGKSVTGVQAGFLPMQRKKRHLHKAFP